MDWTALNWQTLDRLRDGFLSGAAAKGPYWKSHDDLAHYDATFAERIGWKWDAVLAELARRGWSPAPGPLLDYGCGSGVAGRRILRAFPTGTFSNYRVHDHSPLACDFAAKAAAKEFPALDSKPYAPGEAVGTVVLSHILNELSEPSLRQVMDVLQQASDIIWVEPGTHEVGRKLAALRDQLLPSFQVVAPCTHRTPCPLFLEANQRHWCHFFAEPPKGIYADSNWVKFGQRAGVDLRSLPYAFLVLSRRPAPDAGEGLSRVLGRIQTHKAHASLFACDAQGLADLELTKRSNPALFKKLDKKPGLPIYRWNHADGRIEASEELYP